MDHFNTVQELLDWNKTPEHTPNKQLTETTDTKARRIVSSVNSNQDPDLTLEVARYLLGSLVSWHTKALNSKRLEKADDVYIWAYDLAKLNSALDVLKDIQSANE